MFFLADGHIEWLTLHLHPLYELLEGWMACVEFRRAMLMQMSIYDYMQKFPCLRTQEATLLILLSMIIFPFLK